MVKIRRIPLLPEKTDFSGNEFLVVYNPATNITHKIKGSLIAGSTEVVTPESAEIWNPAKVYTIGKIVVYSNEGNVDFATPKLFRCLGTTAAGQSPETHPELWFNEGEEVTIVSSGLANLLFDSENAIKNIAGYTHGNDAINNVTGQAYKYSSTATTGIKPNDNAASTGRWVPKTVFEMAKVYDDEVVIIDSGGYSVTLSFEKHHNFLVETSETGTLSVFFEDIKPGYKQKTSAYFDCLDATDNVTVSFGTHPIRWKSSTGITTFEAGKKYSVSFETAKEDTIDVLLAEWKVMDEDSGGGGGLSSLTENRMLIGGVGNVPEEKTAEEVNAFLGTDDALAHIDGADEEKHTTNQIIEEAEHVLLSLAENSKLNTVISSIINFLSGTINSNELDTTGWDLTEQRLAILERTVDGVQFKGAALLLDIFAPPGVEAALRDNTGWANETKTLTGDNSNGQLGEKGAIIWLNDRVIAQCVSSVKEVSGSATYCRNRAIDVLDPVNSTQDAAICNALDPSYTYPAMTPTGNSTDDGWNLTTQTKVITGIATKKGMWFIGGISGDGYDYKCFFLDGTTSYWKRMGTPSSISRVIYAATHPTLTGRILAHDFDTGAYETQSGDEVTYPDQTFYDATTRGYFIKMINGNWEKII